MIFFPSELITHAAANLSEIRPWGGMADPPAKRFGVVTPVEKGTGLSAEGIPLSCGPFFPFTPPPPLEDRQ